MNALTAAHKTLPLGTRVRVTHERSRRSVVVKINDRGPFLPDRVIDLSRRAAQAIGLEGVARVAIVPDHVSAGAGPSVIAADRPDS
jgi:rare lipoprotein A